MKHIAHEILQEFGDITCHCQIVIFYKPYRWQFEHRVSDISEGGKRRRSTFNRQEV